VTDAGLAELSACGSLTWLDLEGTQITDAGLSHLAGLPLEILELENTSITDQCIASLNSMPKLQVIRLSDPPFTLEKRRKLIAPEVHTDAPRAPPDGD
jgi:hypothetical protein